MKKVSSWILIVLTAAGVGCLNGCQFQGGSDSKPGPGVGTVIPGPGMPGYDAELEARMDLYYRQFTIFNGAAYGVGQATVSVANGNDDDKEIVNRYFNQYPAIKSFKAFCAGDSLCQGKYNALLTNPQDPASKGIFGSVLDLSGLHGGTAMVGEITRYAVLRDEGYPEAMVEEARARVIHQLEVLDVANAISGVPGVLAYNLRRKDYEPAWDGGVPLPPVPPPPNATKDHTWREDNSVGHRFIAEWAWSDSMSGDQVDGWLLAMGVAWDVIRDDPAIPRKYRDMLVVHARNFAHKMMEVAPEFGVDMVLRDADGKLTKNCDVNPRILVLDGCWSAGVFDEPVNPFSAIMGLGFIRVCYHITGDEDIRDFYYQELIGKRKWHLFLRDSTLPISDLGYATNYSGINMAFIAFYNAIRYETDPAVRKVLQEAMDRLWDNGKDHRQPKDINQTFFDVIYSGLRSGGNLPGEVAQGLDTLKQWPYPPPFWAESVINCDGDELAQGECLAVDNHTIIELPSKHDPSLIQSYLTPDLCGEDHGLGHNSDIVAEYVIPRRLRGPSNNDWRSNPFKVNQCGNPYTLEAVPDIIGAYWLGRFLKAGNGRDRNLSPAGRYPVVPDPPLALAASAVSEAQVNLAWVDATYLEDGFMIERRPAGAASFQEIATVSAGDTSYADTGLGPLTTYIYRVIAFNDVGLSIPSNEAPASTFPAPTASPQPALNLAATALDHESILLTWEDDSDNETGFLILRNDVGVVATTYANVTEYTDSGLTDNTLYEYVVIAVNSTGEAWPSNPASATTDKLPLIFAIDPTEGQLNVAYDLGRIQVGFGDPVAAGDFTIEVSDEVGKIEGGWTLSGSTLTFIPDPPLFTMATQYTVTVTVGPVVHAYYFNTQGFGWTVDIAAGQDHAFALNLFRATFVEPPGIAELFQSLGAEVYLLFDILDADPLAKKMKFIAALGDLEGPDPSSQDLTAPTILLPGWADLSANPEFTIGPFDLPISAQGVTLTILNVVLTGIFEENYHYMGKVEFQGDLDAGAIADMFGIEPSALCGVVGGCQACPGEPGRLECVHLDATNIRAEETSDAITPIAAVVMKDWGGTDTEHTLEMSLTHPTTGLPEQNVTIRAQTKDGNLLLDGDSVTYATTGADGKATVIISDPDGGVDQLEAFIESAVSYDWVKAWSQVSFP
ncbi:MAG TPA: hypothetical protein VM658_16755 [bacterium]|nr:hypothetical protein [bacterium]